MFKKDNKVLFYNTYFLQFPPYQAKVNDLSEQKKILFIIQSIF
jgi:hypothetical protein